MDQNFNAPQDTAPQYQEDPVYIDPLEAGQVAAANFIPANSYFLLIDPAGGTAYKDVMCLINFSFAGTTAVNDDSTMCGPASSAGNITSTITFTGKTFLSPGTGKISTPDFFTLWQNRTTFGWKIGKATPTTGDYVKSGTGFLSAEGETFDNGVTPGFSGTISVTGPITQTITP